MCDVLLVDDDSSILLTLSIALRRRGHQVTVACDAQQALNNLARHHFDFLVTDIRMPGMSGLELARRVAATPRHPHVVLTSAHYDPAILPNVAEQVADDFLPKPIDVERLDNLLANLCPRDEPPTHRDHGSPFLVGASPLPQAG